MRFGILGRRQRDLPTGGWRIVTVLVALSFAIALPSKAATRTWNGGGADSNWGTVLNWNGGTVAPSAGDALVFAGSIKPTPANNLGNLSFAGISFSAGTAAFTVTLNSIKFNGATSIANGSSNLQTLNATAIVLEDRDSATVGNSSALSLSGDLKSTTSSLTLVTRTRDNTFTDDSTLTISAGTLSAGTTIIAKNTGKGQANGSLIISGTANVAIAAGSTLASYNIHTTSGSASGTLSISGGSISIGALTLTALTRSANSGGGVNGAIKITGGTTTFTGVLANTGTSSYGTRTSTLTLNGGVLDMGGYAIGDATLPITTTFTAGTLKNLAELNGGAGLAFTGSGTGTLTGSNAFSGGATITSGILNIGTDSSLGTSNGTLTFSGGTLQFGAASTTISSSRKVALNAAAYVDTSLNAGTIASVIGGANGLTKVGINTLTLTAANSFSGGATISAGQLSLSGGNNRLDTTGSLTITGGTLDLGGNTQTTSGTVSFRGGVTQSGTISKSGAAYDAQAGTVNAALAGAAGLTKSGTGVMTLGGTVENTYSSLTTVSAGYLRLNKTAGVNAIGGSLTIAGSGTVTLINDNQIDDAAVVTLNGAGAEWLLNGKDETVAAVNVANSTVNAGGAAGLQTGSGKTLTVTGDLLISGGQITLNSNGSTITAGSVTATGGTWVFGSTGSQQLFVGAGGLSIGAATIDAGSSVSSKINMSGDVTQTTGAGAIIGSGSLTLNAARGFAVNGTSLTVDTIVANGAATGSIAKTGTGTLILTGANTYTGGTTLTAGILRIDADNGLGGTAGTLKFDGGTLQLNWTGSTLVTISSLRTSTITANGGFVDTSIHSGTIASAIGGSGGLTKTGQYTLYLTAANSFEGGTTITAGTLIAVNPAALGAAGAAVKFTGTTGILDLQTATSANAYDVTIGYGNSGTILADRVGSGGGITHSLGALTLSSVTLNIAKGANVASGSPVVQFESLNLGAGSASTATLNPTTADLSIGTVSIGSNSFAKTLQLDGTSGGNAITGAIADGLNTVSLTKANTSTWALSGNNSYTGGTTISAGTLLIGHANALGGATGGAITFGGGTLASSSGAAYTLGNGGSLNFTGDAILGQSSSNTGTGDLTLTGSGSLSAAPHTLTVNNSTTLSGAIGGGGSLTKTGAGTLTLGGINTYSGSTIIDQGTLKYTANNTGVQSLIFGATAGDTTAGKLDLSSANVTATSLTVQNKSAANVITIGSGRTLALNGGVTIGFNSAASTTTLLTLNGLGTFSVNAGNFRVGGNQTTQVSNAATLDMSGLSNFVADLGAGSIFGVGAIANADGASLLGGSTLILAQNSSITAGTFTTDSAEAATQVIKLGSGSNTINANTITIAAITGRDNATFSFNSPGSGTLTIRSQTGAARVANMTVAYVSYTGSNGPDGTVDLTDHSVDVSLNTLNIAGRTSASSNGAIGKFLFDTGTLNTGIITIGYNKSASYTTTGTLSIGGGVANIDSIQMAASTAGIANANLLFSGGSITMAGDIIRTGGAGTSVATLTLSGATLNMGGHDISSAAYSINTFVYSGGLLQDIGTDYGAITLAGTGSREFYQNANVGTISGVIAGSGIGLTKTGGNTLILSGPNTYSGTTLIGAGVLQIGAGGTTGSLSTSSSITDNATLAFNRSNTITQGADFSSVIGGSGNLVQAGSGTLVLNGANSYTGQTKISAGVLNLGTATALDGGGSITFAGGTLQFTANNTTDYSDRVKGSSGAVKLDSNGQSITFASAIDSSNGGGLAKVGAGTLTLAAANAFSGGATLTAGALRLGDSAALGNGTFTISNGTTIDSTVAELVLSTGNAQNWNGDFTFIGTQNLDFGAGAVTMNAGCRVTVGANTLAVGGGISGATFGLTKAGAGTLTLSGAGTYSGGTTLSAGYLNVGNNGALGAGTGTLTVNGGTLLLNNYSVSVGTFSGSGSTVDLGSGALTATQTGGSATYSGTIIGSGSLTKAGAGTLTLSGNNSYSGGTTLNAGILVVSTSANALGTGTIAISGGGGTRLIVSDGLTLANSITIGSNAGLTGRGIIENSSTGSATLSGGTITITAPPNAGGHFSSVSTGTLTINDFITSSVAVIWRTGNGVFSGGGDYAGISMNGGTISLGANNGLSTSATFTVSDSAVSTFDLAGFNQQLVTIIEGSGNAGTVKNSAATLSTLTLTGAGNNTFAGTLTGNLALAKTGAGSLSLSGVNAYSGGTTISGGTLTSTVMAGLGTGSVTVNTSVLNLAASGAAAYTFAGLSGAGTVNVTLGTGSSITTFAAGTYTGFTGTMNVGDGVTGGKFNPPGPFASSATVNILANGTVYLINTGTYGNSVLTTRS